MAGGGSAQRLAQWGRCCEPHGAWARSAFKLGAAGRPGNPQAGRLATTQRHTGPRLLQVITVTCIQLVMAYSVRTWAWWQVVAAAWAISGTLNQNLFSAQHEVGHFMAFRTPLYNKMLSLFGNIPLVVPVATKFREYHHDHHIFMVSAWRGCRGWVWVRPVKEGVLVQASLGGG